ncbi:hypothetical protein TNCV_163651 [Trichonephila clavipes]|nr:hypothetical protein TNCV_163651 [Trichonephila clavipes]
MRRLKTKKWCSFNLHFVGYGSLEQKALTLSWNMRKFGICKAHVADKSGTVILSDSKAALQTSPTIKFALPNEFMDVERFSTLWWFQLSCSGFLLIVASPQDFGPTDLTSTYSVCTRRVFGGIGHRTQGFRSGVRCSNHWLPTGQIEPNGVVAKCLTIE